MSHLDRFLRNFSYCRSRLDPIDRHQGEKSLAGVQAPDGAVLRMSRSAALGEMGQHMSSCCFGAEAARGLDVWRSQSECRGRELWGPEVRAFASFWRTQKTAEGCSAEPGRNPIVFSWPSTGADYFGNLALTPNPCLLWRMLSFKRLHSHSPSFTSPD